MTLSTMARYGPKLFAAYYRGQGNIVPPGEWDAFMASFRTDLPVTFRLNGAGTAARAELERELCRLGAGAPVPWADSVKDGVWQAAAGVDKRAMREGPAAAVVAAATASGRLNRQVRGTPHTNMDCLPTGWPVITSDCGTTRPISIRWP